MCATAADRASDRIWDPTPARPISRDFSARRHSLIKDVVYGVRGRAAGATTAAARARRATASLGAARARRATAASPGAERKRQEAKITAEVKARRKAEDRKKTVKAEKPRAVAGGRAERVAKAKPVRKVKR